MLFLFVLICIGATACGPVTPIPTATVPSITPTRFRTATPSPAPLPFNTPYLTPEIVSYDLPQWLMNSDDHVLMLTDPRNNINQSGKYRTITFMNLDTDQRADLIFPYFNYVFWLDKQHIGFVHGDSCRSFKYGSILSLNTTRVTRYMFKDLDDKRFCPDSILREKAYIDYEDNTAINIYSVYRKVESTYHINQLGAINLDALLSPDSSRMVVLQSTSGSLEYGDRFVIYLQPFYNSYIELVGAKIRRAFSFSQDGSKLYYFNSQTPCIFDLITRGGRCGLPIPETYIPGNLSPVQLDENRIVFSVAITDNQREICIQDQRNQWSDCKMAGFESAICVYDFVSGEISCPTRWLDYLKSETVLKTDGDGAYYLDTLHFRISNVLVSPDGNFVLFESSGPPYFEKKCGIISMNESKYYELKGNACMETWPRYFLAEWRPMR